jgi:hypothetical protein
MTAATLVLGLAWAAPGHAQVWDKKPYSAWTENDCKKLLEDSPWVKPFRTNTVRQVAIGQPTEGTARESQPYLEYIVELRSAPPVRQAVVRLEQIRNKYDRMTPEQKQQFDQQVAPFLDRKFDDIVVHVRYNSNTTTYARDLARYWQTLEPNDAVLNAYLIGPRGERVRAERYVTSRGGAMEFEFIFPRLVNGEPFLRPGDRNLRLEFPVPRIALDFEDTRLFVEFRVDKMLVKGDLVY